MLRVAVIGLGNIGKNHTNWIGKPISGEVVGAGEIPLGGARVVRPPAPLRPAS